MTFTKSNYAAKISSGDTRAVRSLVSGVNAHLRQIPPDPSGFKAVVTLHHADGALCEAELEPVEAAHLMPGILQVINRGNSHVPNDKSDTKREARDV